MFSSNLTYDIKISIFIKFLIIKNTLLFNNYQKFRCLMNRIGETNVFLDDGSTIRNQMRL